MDPIDIDDKSPLQENPLQLQSTIFLRRYLNTIGCWPDKQFGTKQNLFAYIQNKTLGTQVFAILMGSSYYLYYYFDVISFFTLGHLLITAFLCILMIVRVTLPQFEEYGLIVKELMSFHLINYKHKGKHYQEIHDIAEKVSYNVACYELTITSGCILYCAIPIYNNYKLGAFQSPRPDNVTYDFAVFFKYPGFDQNEHFYISSLASFYCSFNCSASLCALDLLLGVIVFQIIGHIKTLMMDMETMPRPKKIVDVTHKFKDMKREGVKALVEKFDWQENKIVHTKLIKLIHHHRLIVGLADRVSTFFGPMLALNYLIHLISGCVLLMECSTISAKDLMRFGPLTVFIFGQLIQISTVFEFVGYMSEKLMDSVYFMPWECMDIRNQRTVCILLKRIQTPIQLTAMGMVPVGVKTMQSILKSTLSFFAFLQTLNK